MKNLLLIAATLVAFNVNAQNISLKAIVQSPLCHGAATGSIDLAIDGGTAPYTFVWSNGATTQSITNITAGIYDVTVNDNGGLVSSTSIKIAEPDQLIATGIAINCSANGTSDGSIDITVRGGTHDYFYAWDNGATSEDISNLTAGTYSVIVTDGFGCQTSLTKTVYEPLSPMTLSHSNHSLSDDNSNNQGIKAPNGNGGGINMNVSVYPNPVSNFMHIKLKAAGESEIAIINNNGQIVTAEKFNTENPMVNVSNLPNGNYIVQVKTATETTTSKIAIVK